MFVANAVKDDFCSILVDFNGFGDTPEPTRPYSVNDYADEVLAVLDREGITSATLVGHSFGGRIALQIAATFPSLVRSLVLIDSAGLKPRRSATYYLKIALHKLSKRFGFGGLKGSKDYRVLSPMMKETFKKVISYDQTPLLRKILCPTAIFWGRRDKVTPRYMARKFVRRIADGSVFMLEGGHFAYAEDKDQFLRVLRAFLESTKAEKTKGGRAIWF